MNDLPPKINFPDPDYHEKLIKQAALISLELGYTKCEQGATLEETKAAFLKAWGQPPIYSASPSKDLNK